MGMTMNMSNYETEFDSMEEYYGAEIMNVGWNPAVALVQQQVSEPRAMPLDLTTVDAELFLQNIYTYLS